MRPAKRARDHASSGRPTIVLVTLAMVLLLVAFLSYRGAASPPMLRGTARSPDHRGRHPRRSNQTACRTPRGAHYRWQGDLAPAEIQADRRQDAPTVTDSAVETLVDEQEERPTDESHGWKHGDDVDWYAENTGPRKDLEALDGLEKVDGRLDVQDEGTVIEDVQVNGPVHVLASNDHPKRGDHSARCISAETRGTRVSDVTIRSDDWYPVRAYEGSRDTVLECCEPTRVERSAQDSPSATASSMITQTRQRSAQTPYGSTTGTRTAGGARTATSTDCNSTGVSAMSLRRNFIDMSEGGSKAGNSAIIIGTGQRRVREHPHSRELPQRRELRLLRVRPQRQRLPRWLRIVDNRFGSAYRYCLFSFNTSLLRGQLSRRATLQGMSRAIPACPWTRTLLSMLRRLSRWFKEER